MHPLFGWLHPVWFCFYVAVTCTRIELRIPSGYDWNAGSPVRGPVGVFPVTATLMFYDLRDTGWLWL